MNQSVRAIERPGADLPELVELLLSGILENPPWYRFLDRLEGYLNCEHATIVLRLPKPGLRGVVISTTQIDWSMQAFHNQGIGTNFLAKVECGRVHTLRRLFTEKELEEQAYYNNNLRKIGIDDLLILNMTDSESGMSFRLRCARETGENRFGHLEIERLTKLLPQIKTALAIYAKISAQQLELRMYDDLADKVAIGTVLICVDGAVVKMNSAARRIFNLSDGIRLRNGKPFSSEEDNAKALRQAIQSLIKVTPLDHPVDDVSFVVNRAGCGKYWSVLCRSVASQNYNWDGASAPSVLMLIRSGDYSKEVCPDLLGKRFGLTNAEARLAAILAQGQSLTATALKLGVSRCTARCQLSSIFEKMDCHRQPQLVSIILNFVNSVWPVNILAGEIE